MTCYKITGILASISLIALVLEMIFIVALCDKWIGFQIFLARTFIIGSFITILSLFLWCI